MLLTVLTALVDVEQQVCLLRNYADALAHSNVVQEEFELPVESITRFINRYLDDLQLLAATLPKNISPSLMQKLKWVYSKGKVTDITRRLQDRKADVTFTLSITGRCVLCFKFYIRTSLKSIDCMIYISVKMQNSYARVWSQERVPFAMTLAMSGSHCKASCSIHLISLHQYLSRL
jgi:hypothetical protein